MNILKELKHTQPTPLTPVEEYQGILVKRDDLFVTHKNARGGKARTCLYLCEKAKELGYEGVVTAGSRKSPQIQLVAYIASSLGLKVQAHTPTGQLTEELLSAKALGAEIVQHKYGYNNVLIARAREAAKETGYFEIPFGMESWEAVLRTAQQVESLVPYYKEGKFDRLVIPVGSGMSLAGVLWGLDYFGIKVPVRGLVVGGSSYRNRLKQYAPSTNCIVTFQQSEYDYHKEYPNPYLGDLPLDPIYEAKCLPYLKERDLLWIVGIRDGLSKD